jgi:glycosyltransferase involved in cell wall biosynthesis
LARILLLSPFEPPSDGIARHSAHLVEAWDRSQHSVLVAAPGSHKGLDEAEIIGPHSKVIRSVRKVPRRGLFESLLAFEPDIVVVQFSIATFNVDLWSVLSLCKRFAALRTPIVVAYHETYREYNLLGPLTRMIYRSMVRVTNVPVVFSTAGRSALVDNNLFDDVLVVPHGTSGVAQVSSEDIERVAREYAIEKSLGLTLGFTGSDKGTDVLLDAAGTIANGVDDNVQFLVAGSPRARRGVFRAMELRDVLYRRRLRKSAQQLSHVDIDFCDYVVDEDVAALLRIAEVVALPYRRSTQSGIGNLALSSRAVLVVSDLQGLRSDLGDAALYVKADDSVALAEAIIGLLGSENASGRERLRELAGTRAAAATYDEVAALILAAGLAERGRAVEE